MTEQELIHEREAQEYLDSLQTELTPIRTETSLHIWTSKEEFTIKQNERIIKAADVMLLDRLENQDGSLKLSEVIGAKDSAFRTNSLIQGKATENLNINIKELSSKTPDALLELWNTLQ